MMMLSLVSERAANFFKLYFQGKILYIPFLYRLNTGWITHLKVRIEILAYKQPTPAAEKEREYRLMVVNILIGIVIATLANANFFEIVKQISSPDTGASLSIRGFVGPFDNSRFIVGSLYMLFFIWSLSLILFSRLDEFHSQIKQYVYKYPFILWIIITFVLVLLGLLDTSLGWCLDIVTHSLGYIFVGMFLSLGSKFWHDLLDVLFYAKKINGKRVDKASYESNNLKEFEEFITLSESEIIAKLYQDNLNYLKSLKNVISVGIGQDQKTQYIQVITTSTDQSEIPSFLTYQLPNHQVKNYSVRVILSPPIVAQNNLSFGSDITNQGRLSNYGSFGLAVKFKGAFKEQNMLLTCYHVIIGNGDDFNSFKYTENDEVVSPHHNRNGRIGKVRYAIRNDKIDAAIIDVTIPISNLLPNGNTIKKYRIINIDEQYSTIPVRIYGYKSRSDNNMGAVVSVNNYASIEYRLPSGEKQNWNMYDLIAVSNNGSGISIDGDSGSALLDDRDNVLGIIVAGNDYITYAIPIETIFNQLNIELL